MSCWNQCDMLLPDLAGQTVDKQDQKKSACSQNYAKPCTTKHILKCKSLTSGCNFISSVSHLSCLDPYASRVGGSHCISSLPLPLPRCRLELLWSRLFASLSQFRLATVYLDEVQYRDIHHRVSHWAPFHNFPVHKTSRETVIRPKHPTPRISCRNDEIFTTFSIPRHLASSNVRASDRSQIARYESSNQSVTPCFWPRTILSIDEPIRASCLMAKSLMDSNCHLAARFKIEVHSSTVVAEYTPI